MDIVYTWVDGEDPAFREERELYLRAETKASFVEAAPRCYLDTDELKFSLRSVEKFAPWFERVFLVTNGQRPRWLNESNPRLTVVTHAEIFSDPAYLPTFSCVPIEHNLHRIPGVSEPFVYSNDDCFFARPVTESDFTQDGADNFFFEPAWCNPERGAEWIEFDDGSACSIGSNPPSWYQSMIHVNSMFDSRYGKRKRRMHSHAPLVVRKSIVERLQSEWPEELHKTVSQRFRSSNQLLFNHSYVHYLAELAERDPTVPMPRCIVLPGIPPHYPEEQSLRRIQHFLELGPSTELLEADFKLLDGSAAKFACVQTEDSVTEECRQLFVKEMQKRFPQKSSFER